VGSSESFGVLKLWMLISSCCGSHSGSAARHGMATHRQMHSMGVNRLLVGGVSCPPRLNVSSRSVCAGLSVQERTQDSDLTPQSSNWQMANAIHPVSATLGLSKLVVRLPGMFQRGPAAFQRLIGSLNLPGVCCW
jgi:hypothetical protein